MIEQFATSGVSWLWNKYGETLIEKAKEKWQKFHWRQAETKYKSRLRSLHSTTRLLGNPKQITIEDIFTDVYVLHKLTAFNRFELTQLKSLTLDDDSLRTNTKRKPALRLAISEKRLYLLGKPGCGKTTFLKYLVLQACNGKIDKTPIYISLKEWSDSGLNLMDFIIRQFEICAFPEAESFIQFMLKGEDKALVLFDGLDEVNQEGAQRSKMIRTLTEFASEYPETHICLTCRIAATDYSFDSFTYLEIADFDERQINQFVNKWYQGEEEKLSHFIREFSKPRHKGLRDMARTPLLLALLCLAFDESLVFPTRLVDLYKEAVDALLKKWDSSRGIHRDEIYRKLSPVRKEHLLARIAAWNFENGAILIRKDTLVSQIYSYIQLLPSVDIGDDVPDGEEILKSIEAQHGLLIERAHSIYSFSHLTFQEYFTARNIILNAANGTIAELTRNHLFDNRWHEVFIMVVSIMDNADALFESLLLSALSLIKDDYFCKWLINFVFLRVQKSENPNHGDRAILLFILLNQQRERKRKLKDFDLIRAIDNVRNESLDLARNLAHDNDLDLARSYIRIKNNRIVQRLDEIDRKRNMTEENAFLLLKYLSAVKLITECLKFAVVTNRLGIEGRLLSPVADYNKSEDSC